MTDLIPGVVQDAATGRVLMLGYLNEDALRLTRETGFVHFWSRSRNELWKKGETSGNTLRVVDVQEDCDGDALLITAEPDGPTCHTGEVSCFDAGGDLPPYQRASGPSVPSPQWGDQQPPYPNDSTAAAPSPHWGDQQPPYPNDSTAAAPSPQWGGQQPPYPNDSATAAPSPQRGKTLDTLWETIRQRKRQRPDGSYTVKLIDGGVDLTGRKVLEEAGEVLMAAKDHAAGNADDQRVAEEAADLMYHLLVLLAERDVELADVMEVLDQRAQ